MNKNISKQRWKKKVSGSQPSSLVETLALCPGVNQELFAYLNLEDLICLSKTNRSLSCVWDQSFTLAVKSLEQWKIMMQRPEWTHVRVLLIQEVVCKSPTDTNWQILPKSQFPNLHTIRVKRCVSLWIDATELQTLRSYHLIDFNLIWEMKATVLYDPLSVTDLRETSSFLLPNTPSQQQAGTLRSLTLEGTTEDWGCHDVVFPFLEELCLRGFRRVCVSSKEQVCLFPNLRTCSIFGACWLAWEDESPYPIHTLNTDNLPLFRSVRAFASVRRLTLCKTYGGIDLSGVFQELETCVVEPSCVFGGDLTVENHPTLQHLILGYVCPENVFLSNFPCLQRVTFRNTDSDPLPIVLRKRFARHTTLSLKATPRLRTLQHVPKHLTVRGQNRLVKLMSSEQFVRWCMEQTRRDTSAHLSDIQQRLVQIRAWFVAPFFQLDSSQTDRIYKWGRICKARKKQLDQLIQTDEQKLVLQDICMSAIDADRFVSNTTKAMTQVIEYIQRDNEFLSKQLKIRRAMVRRIETDVARLQRCVSAFLEPTEDVSCYLEYEEEEWRVSSCLIQRVQKIYDLLVSIETRIIDVTFKNPPQDARREQEKRDSKQTDLRNQWEYSIRATPGELKHLAQRVQWRALILETCLSHANTCLADPDLWMK